LQQIAADGRQLVLQGRDLLTYITRARVPMPKSTKEYVERCERYAALVQPVCCPASQPATTGG
jgi:hypothetical protein